MQTDDPVHFWRGRGVKRRYYAAWKTRDGTWIAMRDRWIPSSAPRQFKRNVKTFGPYPSREQALQALQEGR